MSLTVSNSIRFTEQVKHYEINNGMELYTRIISGTNEGKTAIFIHGGGSGGNHTMLLRPAKWLIEQGLFAKVILPDRRGEGLSTPLTQKLAIRDHSADMKALLDALDINEKITAIGLSYGGPIAIELGGLDSRVNEVILMASSPSLRDVKGIQGFLYRSNLLEKITKYFYKKNLGKLPSEYPDFEMVYDLRNNNELTKYFVEAIKHTDSKMLESLMLQNASTLDQNNSAVSPDIKLDIPIFQVIGSKDEIWETNITQYKNRFTNLKSFIVEDENHKGVILNASLFYEGLKKIYTKE
ncbi:MAG: Serine aminopeptidase [Clostridia bacterium]|jgi:pimeloyl-ACP methyl ester carboxylesterase|nr:Serine aminopeptidase [Clostridia bacterium]